MNFYLREISEADLFLINQWRNDKELIDLLGNNFLFIAEEVDHAWYENYLKNRAYNVRLMILESEKSLPVGTVQLTNIHLINRSAEFSIMIGNKSFWSKGAGIFSTISILKHGFENLNLNRIYLTVLEYNERAIKMYEKTGFRKEGISREAIYKNGKFHNLVHMAILKSEINKS
jgi:RimJ/RimL family protein N-acetyltransferase